MSFNPQKKDHRIKMLFWLLILLFFESLYIFVWLALIPKSGSEILDFSLRRILMLGVILIGGLCFLGYAILLRKSKKAQSYWLSEIKRKQFIKWFLPATLALTLISWCLIFLIPLLKLQFVSADLYTRSLPILTWVCLTGWQALIFIPLVFIKNKKSDIAFQPWKEKTFLHIFFLLIFLFVFITLSRLGIAPLSVFIIDLGAPLLEGQILFSVGLLFLVLWTKEIYTTLFSNPKQKYSILNKHGNSLILIGLWLIGAIIWMSQPLPTTNYFTTRTLPPNYETYPFSDASLYDFNSLKVIYGSAAGQIITKPGQVTYLALLHLIGGNDYFNIVLLQTLLFAFFPPILYLIGKKIFNRNLGIILALFAIFRELTSIQAVNIANVSNSKLLLSETITTLLIAFIVLLAVQWIKNSNRQIVQSIYLGSVIGLLALIRIQIIFVLPVFLFIGLIKYYRNWKERIKNLSGLMVGIGVVSLPMILRNYSITGSIWFENPVYIDVFTGFYTTSAGSGINLIQSLTMVIGNFLHSCISTLLVFPARLGTVGRVMEFVTITQPFWANVPINLHFIDFLLILINLCIISLGISWLWRKERLVCILLLGIYVLYNLSNAVINISGWRFIQPVDWFIYIFYGLGVLGIINILIRKIFGREIIQIEKSQEDKSKSSFRVVGLIAVMVLFSSAISLREGLFPQAYPYLPKNELCQEVLDSAEQFDDPKIKENFRTYCFAEDTMAVKGLAFYPVFLEAGDFLRTDLTDIFFGPQRGPHLVFSLVSSELSGNIIYPIHKSPVVFPNGSEVIVIGDLKGKQTARYVYLTKLNTLIRSNK
jgi:hypothetical protein